MKKLLTALLAILCGCTLTADAEKIREADDVLKVSLLKVGKAAVIARAVRDNNALDPKELVQLSMKDLMVKLHQEGADIDDYFDDLDDYYEFIREADEDDFDDIIDDLDDEDEDDRDDDGADLDDEKQPALRPSPKPDDSKKRDDHDDDDDD